MTSTKIDLKSAAKKYVMYIAFAVIVIVFQIWTDGVLLVPQNVTNLIQQNSYILILAVGMLLCIIAGGHIDLSVGSVAALVGALSAKLCINGNASPALAIVMSLALGLVAGAITGYLVAYLNIASFIVTLAGQLIYRGLTLVILAGRTLSPFPEGYQLISTGFIPDFFNVPGIHMTSVVIGILICPIILFVQIKGRREKIAHHTQVPKLPVFIVQQLLICGAVVFLAYWLALYEGIPAVLVLLLVLIGIFSFVTNQTVMGRHLYAMGGNAKAAALSGVKTKLLLFLAFVNMGVLSALAGIVFSGRLNAATPKAGTEFAMDAISACYIGGASSSGGIGTVGGAIVGGLIMGVLNNGMSILGINVDWQQVIKGVVLLLAVLFDTYSKNKVKK